MTTLIRNEQTKLTAAALNTAATSSFALGVLAPMAAAFYSVKEAAQVNFATLIIGSAAWLTVAVLLHIGARAVLKELRP